MRQRVFEMSLHSAMNAPVGREGLNEIFEEELVAKELNLLRFMEERQYDKVTVTERGEEDKQAKNGNELGTSPTPDARTHMIMRPCASLLPRRLQINLVAAAMPCGRIYPVLEKISELIMSLSSDSQAQFGTSELNFRRCLNFNDAMIISAKK